MLRIAARTEIRMETIMKKGLNAVCYEEEMHIYFERAASLKEEDYYEVSLSDGQRIQTKKTNVSFLG